MFRGRAGSLAKIIWLDDIGLSFCAKRLEKGQLSLPGVHDCVMRLTATQLNALLAGLDWRRLLQSRHTRGATVRGISC